MGERPADVIVLGEDGEIEVAEVIHVEVVNVEIPEEDEDISE